MYRLIRPLLFRLQAERAHRLTFKLLRLGGPVARGLARLLYGRPHPMLETKVAGLTFPGPVGLAAGLDKDGELAKFWPTLGFGSIEMGTVTAHPQVGNSKPRMFRFPVHRAVINRMGFNNLGSEALVQRLKPVLPLSVPVGVNIGMSKVTPLDDAVDDYVASAQRAARVCDYLVVNVSSPNTPGLRKLQDGARLGEILAAVISFVDCPVFVKLSPDMTPEALKDAVRVITDSGAAGIIATNTTIERYGVPDVGPGGLSGRPLHSQSVETVRFVCENTDLPVIAAGGIDSTKTALNMLEVGAVSVQLYTGLVFQGPGLVHRINKGLKATMDQAGCHNMVEFRSWLQVRRFGRPYGQIA